MNSCFEDQQQLIGSGAYSNVYKYIRNDKIYALKKIHPYLLKDQSKRKQILTQIQIMRELDHPNIIKFHQCIQNSQNQINILLQYADAGTLFEYLKFKDKLKQKQAKIYIKNIIKAIKYLHSRHQPILHRDIKPQNILLMKNGQCKLADFGSSNILNGQRTTFIGTKQYMAPQIIHHIPYGQAIDLWCIGILIYQLVIGQVPKQNYLITNKKISRSLQDLIKKLLNKNPQKRMTIQQLQQHIWFNNVQFNSENINQQKLLKTRTKLNQISVKNKNLYQYYKNKLLQHKLQQQKRSIEQHQLKICQSLDAEQYLEMIDLKTQLKVEVIKNQNILINFFSQYQFYKKSKIEQNNMKKEKIQEYLINIQILRKHPLKFNQEIYANFNHFLKKADLLYQQVKFLPQKLHQQVLHLPEIKNKKDPSILNQNFFKLKSYFLQFKQQILIDYLANKKRN